MTLNFKTLSIFRTFGLIAGMLGSIALVGCAGATRSGTAAKKEIPAEKKGELLVLAAEGANNEGDIVGALQILQDAEKYVPRSPALHFTRASSFYLRNDFPSAIVHLKRALEIDPKYSQANNMLGKIYLDQGKFELSEKFLKLAANDLVFRDGYKAWTNLGILYYRNAKYNQASDALDAAVSVGGPDACLAHYFRGHLLMKTAKYAEAIREYVESTKRQCGGFAEAHLAVAVAYERSQQFELARKKYLEVQQLFPNTHHSEQALVALSKLP